MKTLYLPVKEFHRGNTATYLERALPSLGLSGRIVSSDEEFAQLLRTEGAAYFLCVDSGAVFDFRAPQFADLSLERVGYWLIDFRHHRSGPRTPTDDELCQTLHERGGLIFQAQHEDFEACQRAGWTRSSHIPLAADPEIWSDQPAMEKRYHLAFAGNVWDRGRATVLETLLRIPTLRFGFPGHGSLWMEDAAKLLRQSLIGFNVNSWYGTNHAFDLNMRFYETLSCGIPLLTNWVPAISRLFPNGAPFLATYSTPEELPELISRLLNNSEFLRSGPLARDWIVSQATYVHRLREIVSLFEARG